MVDLTTGSKSSAIDRLESKMARDWQASSYRLQDSNLELTTKVCQLIEKAFAQHKVDMENAVSNLAPSAEFWLIF